jgi:hypothetical protein
MRCGAHKRAQASGIPSLGFSLMFYKKNNKQYFDGREISNNQYIYLGEITS